MTLMLITRWALVGLLYLIADLTNPLALGPLEAFESEEQSVRATSRERVERLRPAARIPTSPVARGVAAAPRPPGPTIASSVETRRRGQPRKVPTVRPDSARAPEDH
jgi:hypothetical protein